MNIRRIALCLVWLGVFIAVRAQSAPAERLKVTRDNFVSLTWSVRSNADSTRTVDYFLDKNAISLLPVPIAGGFGGGFPPYTPPVVKPLSTNQFESLLRALQLADVPALAGATQPQNARETLVLTLSDANDADQSFAIASAGENSPAAYRQLSDYLVGFVRGKALAENAPAAPADAAPASAAPAAPAPAEPPK